jgi:type IV secretion system protein VirD4
MKALLACLLAIACGVVTGSGVASVFLTFALRRDILTADLMLHYTSVMAGMWTQQPYLIGHLIMAGFVAIFVIVARALPETNFRRCVRTSGGQVQSSG